MSHKSQRLSWRARCRRWQRTINAFLALSLAVAVLLPAEASGQTRWDYCYRIPHGTVCVARAAKITRIVCDWGWQPQFGRTPRCVAMEVQP